MIALAKKLWNDETGQGLVEYALIIALVGVVLVVALQTLATKIGGTFDAAGNKMPQS